MTNETNTTVDAEFQELNETEELTKTEETGTQPKIEKGVLVFQLEDGSTAYQLIGDVTLENLTYYTRYLKHIESDLWDNYLGKNTK